MSLFRRKKPEFIKTSKKSYSSNRAELMRDNYELCSITMRDMQDILKYTDTGVVGTARLLQRVSIMTVKVSDRCNDIDDEIAKSCGIEKIAAKDKNIDDIFFISGPVIAFYRYAHHFITKNIPSASAKAFSGWLRKMDSNIFTVKQYDDMGWNNYHSGIDYLDDDIIKPDEDMAYDVGYFIHVIENTAPVDLRTIAMATCEFYILAEDVLILFYKDLESCAILQAAAVTTAEATDDENPDPEPIPDSDYISGCDEIVD